MLNVMTTTTTAVCSAFHFHRTKALKPKLYCDTFTAFHALVFPSANANRV